MQKFRGADADSAMAASVRKKGRWSKALTRAIREAEAAKGMRAAMRGELLVDHQNYQYDEDIAVKEEDEKSMIIPSKINDPSCRIPDSARGQRFLSC